MKKWYVLIGILLLVGLFLLMPNWTKAPTETTQTETAVVDRNEAVVSAPTETSTTRRLFAAEIQGVGLHYQFSAVIPSDWQATWIADTKAINLYDPKATGDSTLEQSQIFIRSFEANQFLTLQTVTIHEQTDTIVDGRPARRYDIEKKPGVAAFANQPNWRSSRHSVTDVRVTDDNPSIFYVIAKRPDLDQAVFDAFLASFRVRDQNVTGTESQTTDAIALEPVDGFLDRITKKPFGILINPATSPVQPERFSGYHTGADAEFGDVNDEVEVRAIADGTVEVARTADGYGGVVVIKHDIDGSTYHIVYGHLDPSQLPAVGTSLSKGQRIGQLGAGGSNETDGERKHLHLGVFTGSQPDLRGNVDTQDDLTNWLDPVSLYK